MAARTLPNIGLEGGYEAHEDGWAVGMAANLLKLSLLVQAGVIDKVAAEPGSPAPGDVYILDETHATHPNEIAAFEGDTGEEAWVYLVPLTGWMVYNQTEDYYEKFDGAVWAELVMGGGGSGTAVPYNVPMGFTSTPLAGEILLLHVFPEAVTFPDDWAGAESYVGVNPTTDPVAFDIKKNGGSVGTVSITAAGVVTFTTSGTTVAFAAGDVLSVHGPGTADATIANVALTFVGDRP